MTEHAKLSASGAHRWMLCPGSVKAEENIPEQSNKYADEGTLAHEIAAIKLINTCFLKDTKIKYYVSKEMKNNINEYIKYVENIFEESLYNYEYRYHYSEYEKEKLENTIYIEKKVDFSNIVPDGFGTADCIIKTRNYPEQGNVLHIVDFKYGLNPINAYNNMQLLLYALGALNLSGPHPDEIIMHIVQPRINNYSTWKLSFFELSSYVQYIKYKALEALKDDAPRIPSKEACQWCKARYTCYALNNVTKEVITLADKQDLTNSDIKHILDNAEVVKSFISSIEGKIYEQLISGEKFEGYKLVEGRSIRKLKEDSEQKLVALLGEKVYTKSIINITELDKLLSKDEVASLVYLSKSKPKLVKEGDKRSSIMLDSLVSEVID